MRGVEGDDLVEEEGDGVRVCGAVPLWALGRGGVAGDVLRVVEMDVAVDIWVGDAVEGADSDEVWRAGDSMGGEEFVEERCGAVEQDGLGTEEEVGVCGFGVLVAVVLMLGEDGLVV